MTNTPKPGDEFSGVQRRFRRWVKAYAGDALQDDQAMKLADRLSTAATEWARCTPDQEDLFLEKVKIEILREFLPRPSVEPSPSRPLPVRDTEIRLGKSLVIRGELSGSESVYIDGQVEGSIIFPGNRVTIGRNGVVAANINAGEIVILGRVRGNLTATGRVEIRNQASLTGEVVAQRVSIEDGAFFQGGVDIRKAANVVAMSTTEGDRGLAAQRNEGGRR